MTSRSKFGEKYIIKSFLFCLVFTALLVVFSLAKGFIPPEFERLAHGIIGTAAAFLTTVLFLKIDRKQFAAIGLTFERDTLFKFFGGVIVGVIIMGLLAVGVIYFTNMKIDVNPGSDFLHFLLATAPLLLLAFMEELGFRAYPVEILKDKIGIRLTILITSVFFAIYHIVNGWTIAGSFYGPGIWGLIFGLAAIYSRGIAMPTGIHYAANLTTAAFGEINNTVSIWTISKPDGASANDAGIDWTLILPGLALLIFAIICVEVFIRRRNTHNRTLPQRVNGNI